MKSALFVDFDNVYSGLRRLDQTIADRFAQSPLQWMNWVVDSLEAPEHAPSDARRRILVRRCYLNPQAYQRFRSSFNVAGFEIIDCPSLTGEGKTSTDIHMVLDIMDLLQHEAHYDEFIVFSADADFTPVLRKLRRWDRRTTVLAIGFPSAAYRASADLLIDQDEFVRQALGFRDEEEPAPAPSVTATRDTVGEAIDLVKRMVTGSAVPVPLAKAASTVLASVEGINADTWAGLGSFRNLIESRNMAPLQIAGVAGGYIFDPIRHTHPATTAASQTPKLNLAVELVQVADLIKQEVSNAPQPMKCAQLASLIMVKHGTLAADWNGKQTFRRFIESLDLSPIEFNWSASGGYASSPMHDQVPAQSEPQKVEECWRTALELLPVARQIHDVTGIPLLPPQKYRALFSAIAADIAAHPFDLNETGKRVRDQCRDIGQAVSRADVTFVLRGLLLRGHTFGQGKDDPHSIAKVLADNVRSLCLREQMVLDSGANQVISTWIAAD
jgi:hypothetical protein